MMQFKVILSSALTLLLLESQKVSAECLEPWIDLGYLGCFYFAEESELLNWYDAQHYCNELNEKDILDAILRAES